MKVQVLLIKKPRFTYCILYENYTKKAPPHLVQETRDALEAAQRELKAIDEQLTALG